MGKYFISISVEALHLIFGVVPLKALLISVRSLNIFIVVVLMTLFRIPMASATTECYMGS